jgi:peptidoglycan glycosyltransferase
MNKRWRKGQGWPLLIVFALGLSFAAGANPLDFFKKLPLIGKSFDFDDFQRRFHAAFYEGGKLPGKIAVKGTDYTPEYTVRPQLEDAILGLWRRYRPEFTSIVVVDNNNGKILAAIDMARDDQQPGRIATFSPTHPAASIFKIVTAADLLENTHVGNQTQFLFAGRSTTLYKSQLKQNRPTRFARKTDFEDAFARSNNVIFGKAALENLSPTGLKRMAEKFGFNKSVIPLAQRHPSVFPLAVDQYNLAELASGFNTRTMMSPVHGAMIASVIANGGIMRWPNIIARVKDPEGNVVWEPSPTEEMVVAPETAADLRRMMIATVEGGTARKPFRRTSRGLVGLEIGGKTGSITGGEPFGKRDWFVAYAKDPARPADKGISLCVMIVNKRKWYVKSTQLTKDILELIWGATRGSADLRRTLWKNRT